MAKNQKKEKKLPFQVISLVDYSRAIHERREYKEKKAARRNASPVTVYKPDSDGNLVASEQAHLPRPVRSSRNRNRKRIWSTL